MYSEVNGDFEDDWVLSTTTSLNSYLQPSCKSLLTFLRIRTAPNCTSFLSIWSLDRADIFGSKFAYFDDEKRFWKTYDENKFRIHIFYVWLRIKGDKRNLVRYAYRTAKKCIALKWLFNDKGGEERLVFYLNLIQTRKAIVFLA